MKKRSITVLIIAGLLSALLSGCQTGPGAGGETPGNASGAGSSAVGEMNGADDGERPGGVDADGNAAADGVLYHYGCIARAKNIEFSVCCYLKDIAIPDTDFCTILHSPAFRRTHLYSW